MPLDLIAPPEGVASPDEATQPAAEPAFDEAAFLLQARQRLAHGLEADRENREADIDDRKFRAGEQWPESVKQERVNRPCLTINKTGQYIRQVTGDIRLNKPAIKVSPAEDGDVQTADVYEGLIRHIERASKAQRVYVDAAEDATTGGQGYLRVRTEYATWDGWTQDICIRHIRNPLSVIMDPEMTDATGRDAAWCFVYDDMPRDEYESKYPTAPLAGIDLADTTNSGDTSNDGFNTGEKATIRVAEYWELREEPCRIVRMSDGQTLKDPDEQTLMQAEAAGVGIEMERQGKCPALYFSMIGGGQSLLEPPRKMEGYERIPVIRVVGEEIRIGARVVRHGLIRFLKDAQRIDNYSQSAMVERIALAPKAPFLVTPKNIEGFEQHWRELATGNPNVLVFNPDPITGMPQRIAPAPVEPGLTQLAMLAADNMKAVTGIYDASLGARSNETSGVAIEARKQEGEVGTYVYADNLADAITEAGRVIVTLIPTVYDTPRQIRILGQNMQPKVVEVNSPGLDMQGNPIPDLTKGKYDVAVDTGPSFTSRRNAAAAGMNEFIRNNPQAAPLLGDLLAKNSDWPDADEVSARLAPFAQLAIAQAEAQIEQIMMQRQMAQQMMAMGGAAGGPAPFAPPGAQPPPGPRPA